MIDFPDPKDKADVKRYFKEYDEYLDYSSTGRSFTKLKEREKRLTLAIHKIIFDIKKDLPHSFEGLDILDYTGVSDRKYGNPSGGKWDGPYGGFTVAAERTNIAMHIAVRPWGGGESSIRLCVGVEKPHIKHHALQLNCAKEHVQWDDKEGCWHFFHNQGLRNLKGAGGSGPFREVLDMVSDTDAKHLIGKNEKGNKRIYLGKLHPAELVTWGNSREFLARLLHYASIRSSAKDT